MTRFTRMILAVLIALSMVACTQPPAGGGQSAAPSEGVPGY
ncbi:MAG TPA: hypothetical protein VH813_05500 [Candidatus Limnocylindrales bacterium]|jgi:hypothetical protein